VGLVQTFRDAGARVLIHVADEPTLRNPRPKSGDGAPIKMLKELWRPQLWHLVATMMVRDGGITLKPYKGELEAFSDGDALDVPGQPRVIATPGHTAGHSALYFERHRALFVGDEMCTWNPLTGNSGPQLMPKSFNVSLAQCRDSLGAIEDVPADVLLPGHGEPWRDTVSAAVKRAREEA
jgi:glyoxylase-like metal-dependent hydrolase (beta-lactamase superfamily II)